MRRNAAEKNFHEVCLCRGSTNQNNAAVCSEEVEADTNFLNSTTDLVFGNGGKVHTVL